MRASGSARRERLLRVERGQLVALAAVDGLLRAHLQTLLAAAGYAAEALAERGRPNNTPVVAFIVRRAE